MAIGAGLMMLAGSCCADTYRHGGGAMDGMSPPMLLTIKAVREGEYANEPPLD